MYIFPGSVIISKDGPYQVGKYTIHDMDPYGYGTPEKAQKRTSKGTPPIRWKTTTPKVETPKKLIMEVVIAFRRKWWCF